MLRMGKTICVLGLGLGLVACGGDDKKPGGSAAGELKIGTLHAQTGNLGTYGGPINQGIDLAIKEINAAGGVLGKQLRAIHKDDGSDATRAQMAATQLVDQDRVVGIIGALASGGSVKVLEVTTPRSIPQISAASTSPALTGTAADNFFRTVPSDAQQAVVLANRAQAAGLSKVAILYVAGPYGEGLANAFERKFMMTGSVTSKTEFMENQAAYTNEVRASLAGQPDAVLLVGYPEDGVKIFQEAKAQGATAAIRWLLPDGLKDQSFIDNLNTAKDLAEAAIGTAPGASDDPADIAHAMTFKAAFTAAYAKDPGTYVDTGYDAMYVLALAIQKAGSEDPASIVAQIVGVTSADVAAGAVEVGPGEWAKAREALTMGKSVNYQGAGGRLDMDMFGDPSGVYTVWTVTGGRLTDVETARP